VPQWLLDLFSRYGYGVVFLGVFLENTGVPVPGETVLLAGSALAHDGTLALGGVIATATAAAILGDNLGFWLGRRGGRRWAEQYGPRIGLTAARFEQFDRFFERHGPKTVFLARFITGLRVFGALLAGSSDLPWRTFLLYNATGAIVWCTAVSIAGYALGHSWQALEAWIGRLGLIASILAVAVAIRWFTRGRPQGSRSADDRATKR
jgi:membrane protein DedA with SNARE-associated domain